MFHRQQAVWSEIRRKHRATATRSEKENLSDVLETHRDRVDDLRCRLPYPGGASGIVVVLGDKVVTTDLFDRSSTLEKLWDRLVQGVALDALEFGDLGCQEDCNLEPVRLYMEKVRNMRWQKVATIGLGEGYRAQGQDGTLATALVVDGVPVHVSVSMPTHTEGD